MVKKVFLALIFLAVLLQPVVAEEITGYNVPAVVPLNQTLTIFGLYSEGGEQLCAFFIFDADGDQNQAIIRLSDEYTFEDGSFYAEYNLTEPKFRRGEDYNAVTKCGAAVSFTTFYVGQKEDIIWGISTAGIRTDFAFWLDRENSFTVVLALLAILVIAALAYGVWMNMKEANR